MVSKKASSGSSSKTKKGASKAKAKAMPASEPIKRSYVATMSSLQALELRCEQDETDLFARIVGLALATNNGADVTGGTYEIDEESELGNLAFEEYKTDVDEQSLKAIHKTKGDTFLFKGQAFVKNKPIKVLAFREG